MAVLIVDPWVLTFSGKDDPDEYVQCLTDLYDASREGALSVQITAQAVELLEADGTYPLSRDLPGSLWPMRSDVYRIVANLLDRLPKIEDQEISAVLADSCDIELPGIRTSSLLHVEYLMELLPLAVVRSVYYGVQAPLLSRVVVSSSDISVESNVMVIDSVDCYPQPDCGLQKADIPVKLSMNDFYEGLTPTCLAMQGFVGEAIALSVWKQRKGPPGFALTCAGWSLSDAFLESVGRCNLGSNMGRMESMIRTSSSMIVGKNMRITHALRSGPGAGCKQISRKSDGATAWRADIDDELHLHYWKIGDALELANVVFHNDFHIDGANR
ncbi:hypothetical protein [Rhodanobacter ginsenosidimutans]|uniref:Uncharacterized protein n=1 Tax=Rhodanobacter ginsenosidimutans TaxID=490571 RepID=A0ABW0JUM0_9GAMM